MNKVIINPNIYLIYLEIYNKKLEVYSKYLEVYNKCLEVYIKFLAVYNKWIFQTACLCAKDHVTLYYEFLSCVYFDETA